MSLLLAGARAVRESRTLDKNFSALEPGIQTLIPLGVEDGVDGRSNVLAQSLF